MPPYLAIPHYHLSRLPVTTKVALTIFSVSLLSAVVFVAAAVFAERTGYTPTGVQANYGGSERLAEERGIRTERFHAEKSKREVYDIVHPHSFLMPVIFFILCHLMEMAYAPRWAKLALYLVSGLSMLTIVFSPLLIWSSLSLAPILVPAVVAMLLCFAVMTVVPTWQMWRGERGSAAPVATPPPRP